MEKFEMDWSTSEEDVTPMRAWQSGDGETKSYILKDGLIQDTTVRPLAQRSQGLRQETSFVTALPPPSTANRSSCTGSAPTAAPTDSQSDDGLRPGEEDESHYPKSWKLAVIMIALCLAVFCMALDNTIIATAIPKITDTFKVLDDVAWYVSAYLLTTCSFQLFFGRLYSFLSIKWVFLTCVAIFELGSLICGVAPTSNALIVGRAIAGLGSAGLFSGGMLIIAHTVPLRQRAIFTGFVGAMYGVASVAGPLLGGVFTDKLTWRWCFYINLPIGAITILFIFFFFKSPVRRDISHLTWKQKVIMLDLPGTLIFVPAIVCLLLALQWGGSTYAWSNVRIIILFIMFVLLMAGFAVIQHFQKENATLPARILFQRPVLASSWFAVTLGGAFFILIYYVPIWFQAIKGVSAVHSGIDSLPLVLSVSVFSVVSGVGVTLEGHYLPWMVASSVIMSIGCGLVTTFQVDSPTGIWIGYQILAGAGFGMGIQNPLIVVQAVLPLDDVPTGTALIIFSQTLGGALFIAVGQNVFLNQLAVYVGQFIPGFSIQLLYKLGATALSTNVPPELLAKVIFAYNKALNQTFYVAAALGALSILGAACVGWKSVKGKNLLAGGL